MTEARVGGVAAIGRRAWDWRHLVVALALRDVKVRYRRSVLGIGWTLIHPLLLMATLTLVFSQVFRFEVENYALYVISGVLLWNFFSQGLIAAVWSVRGNSATVRSTAIPAQVFPAAAVMAAGIHLGFALAPLAVAGLAFGVPFGWRWLWPLVAVFAVASLAFGLALILAPAALEFADIHELVAAIMMIWMYATPVFYPLEIVPEPARSLVLANPMTTALTLFRAPLSSSSAPSAGAVAWLVVAAVAVAIVGAACFSRLMLRGRRYV